MTAYFFLRGLKKKRLLELEQKLETVENKVENIPETDNLICRTCLKKGSVPIYGQDTPLDLSEAIQCIGDIELCESDQYPKYLCDACYSLLQGAMLFRKSAKEAETRLRLSFPKIDPPINTEPNETHSDPDNDLEYEENRNTKQSSYKCKLCQLSFSTHKEFAQHKNSKQHRIVRVQCPICFGLLTAQLYKKHMARHESASHLICDVCGKLCRKYNLARHMQLHSYELPYQCQVCPYRGRYMESLKIHMRTHTGDKPFACDKCPQRFLTRSNLKRHLLTHKKDRPFKCIECGRGFYTKKDMDNHFKCNHAGIKDFECRMCGNKYGTRKILMKHELRVHKREKMAIGQPLYLQAEYRK